MVRKTGQRFDIQATMRELDESRENNRSDIESEPEKPKKVKRSYMFEEEIPDLVLELKLRQYKREDLSDIVAMAIEDFYDKHYPGKRDKEDGKREKGNE